MALPSKNVNAPWYSGNNGATNFTRSEAQRFARQIVESQDYRDSLTERIKNKTLPPAVEMMLWHYAYGKPMESIALSVTQGVEDLSSLSVDELLVRAKALNDQLEEAKALADAIPANVLNGPWAP